MAWAEAYLHTMWHLDLFGRRLGVVASVIRRMNEVTVHGARLVLG